MKFKRVLGLTLILLSFVLVISNVKMVGYFIGDFANLRLFNLIPIVLFLSGMTLFFVSGIEEKVIEEPMSFRKRLRSKVPNITDKTMNVATNTLMGAGALEGAQYLSEQGVSGYTTGLASAAAMAGIYGANKLDLVNKAVKGTKNLTGKIKGKSKPWIQGAALGVYMALAGAAGYNVGSNISKDFSSSQEKVIPAPTPKPNYDLANYRPDFSKKITAPRESTKGKFERTNRFDELIDKVEGKYGIQKGVLAALAMREGYGNPLQLNSSNDGGAGMIQMQPGMARHYGLKTFGKSKRLGRDRIHGKKLKKLLDNINYDYGKAAKYDERFDVVKNVDAAGRMMRDLYKVYKNWDKAISAYNVGQKKFSKVPTKTSHVKHVREFQKYYNARDSVDFTKPTNPVDSQLANN